MSFKELYDACYIEYLKQGHSSDADNYDNPDVYKLVKQHDYQRLYREDQVFLLFKITLFQRLNVLLRDDTPGGVPMCRHRIAHHLDNYLLYIKINDTHLKSWPSLKILIESLLGISTHSQILTALETCFNFIESDTDDLARIFTELAHCAPSETLRPGT
jgi:hypothetical protein